MSGQRTGYGVLPCVVMDDEELSVYAKMLYIALSSYAGLREIRPGHKQLGKIVGCSERKIRDALEELRTKELIEWRTVATPTGKVSIYRNIQPWTGSGVRHGIPDVEGVRRSVPDRSGTNGGGGPAPRAGEITIEETKEIDSRQEAEDGFDRFYHVYPRHVARGQAARAWKTAVKKADPATIISAAVLYAQKTLDSDPKFIAHPSTWLNGERWADDTSGPASTTWGYG